MTNPTECQAERYDNRTDCAKGREDIGDRVNQFDAGRLSSWAGGVKDCPLACGSPLAPTCRISWLIAIRDAARQESWAATAFGR
jgi:hypothetical protein